ncbi:hypothetical protein O3P69_010439 [Scylla paramamosain]|uniref:Uncharacterized protein n=1 Tax=Scylla paramamosain TaxID=85552 RepID=A0AAW0TTQ6_SCYPA
MFGVTNSCLQFRQGGSIKLEEINVTPLSLPHRLALHAPPLVPRRAIELSLHTPGQRHEELGRKTSQSPGLSERQAQRKRQGSGRQVVVKEPREAPSLCHLARLHSAREHSWRLAAITAPERHHHHRLGRVGYVQEGDLRPRRLTTSALSAVPPVWLCSPRLAHASASTSVLGVVPQNEENTQGVSVPALSSAAVTGHLPITPSRRALQDDEWAHQVKTQALRVSFHHFLLPRLNNTASAVTRHRPQGGRRHLHITQKPHRADCQESLVEYNLHYVTCHSCRAPEPRQPSSCALPRFSFSQHVHAPNLLLFMVRMPEHCGLVHSAS